MRGTVLTALTFPGSWLATAALFASATVLLFLPPALEIAASPDWLAHARLQEGAYVLGEHQLVLAELGAGVVGFVGAAPVAPWAYRVLVLLASLTARAAEAGADLVVWGETAVPQPWPPGEPPAALLDALAPAPTVLFGAVSFDGVDTTNAIFHAVAGVITEVYRKRALVPINERQYSPGGVSPALEV